MTSTRTQHIHDELLSHFDDVAPDACRVTTADEWQRLLPELGPQAVMGWSWPIPDDEEPVVIPLCPELIADYTAEFSDELLESCLDIIEWVVDTHVMMWTTEPDPHDRQRAIEDELEAVFPGSLEMWMRMQLAIFDQNACT